VDLALRVTAAREGVPAALEAYKRADADLNRTQSLVSTGDLPKSQLDSARANAAAAQAQRPLSPQSGSGPQPGEHRRHAVRRAIVTHRRPLRRWTQTGTLRTQLVKPSSTLT